MQTSKARRKVAPTTDGDSGDKQDQLLLSAAICNGEDLGPFVRKAFSSGKPETLLQHLRSLLSDVDSLKSALHSSNSQLQSVAGPLLSSLDSFVEARHVSRNVSLALDSITTCVRLTSLCARSNLYLSQNNFYMALKCVDSIETG